jgi:hypothetical protein
VSIHDLPAVNASLNGLSAVFLTAGFVFIRRGNKTAHRNCMIAAFVTSIVFLACYLTYHTWLAVVLHQGPTRFLEPQWFRGGDCADDFNHAEPRAAATLRAAQKNRALDMATVDVCVRDRRGGLSVALPDFPANQTVAADVRIF